MDVLIDRLRVAGIGCKLAQRFFGCLLYADDIVQFNCAAGSLIERDR